MRSPKTTKLTCWTHPAPGYPPGGVAGSATTSGEIHVVFAFVTITALAVSSLVLARRLYSEECWRGWTPNAVITGLLTIIFISAFGAMGAHGGVTGGFERSAGGVNSLFGLALLIRLFLQYYRAREGSTSTIPTA